MDFNKIESLVLDEMPAMSAVLMNRKILSFAIPLNSDFLLLRQSICLLPLCKLPINSMSLDKVGFIR
jgi:hypothetical protein